MKSLWYEGTNNKDVANYHPKSILIVIFKEHGHVGEKVLLKYTNPIT